MSARDSHAELILVQGLYRAGQVAYGLSRNDRDEKISRHAETLGVLSYEQVSAGDRRIANSLLRRMRGTAPVVDMVEIMSIDESGLRRSLDSDVGRAQWRELAGCESGGYDTGRSFILMGRPRRLLEGDAGGQRVLWFGNGMAQLSRAEFIRHYTTRHGPLVAGHSRLIGLRNYLQVPDEEDELCVSLRGLGLGQAVPPAVFAQLSMGTPPLSLSALRARREATREIEADEKRHIGFGKSMLLLAGRANRKDHTASTNDRDR